MFCPFCGKESPSENDYCPKCGNSLLSIKKTFLPSGTLNKIPTDVPEAPSTSSIAAFENPIEWRSCEPHLWRRFFARLFDFQLFSFPIVLLISHFIPNQPLNYGDTTSSNGYWVVISLISLPIWFLIESCMISFFGTTPGKWIWGIFIENEHGNHIPLRKSIKRSLSVWGSGLYLGIPPFTFIALLVNNFRMERDKISYWDKKENLKVWHYQITFTRILLIILCFFLLTVFYSFENGKMIQNPINRGITKNDLTSAKSIAETINLKCPQRINSEIVLNNASTESGLKLVYNYTLLNQTKENINENVLRPIIIEILSKPKNDNNLKNLFLSSGIVSVIYRFFGNDKKLIWEKEIDSIEVFLNKEVKK